MDEAEGARDRWGPRSLGRWVEDLAPRADRAVGCRSNGGAPSMPVCKQCGDDVDSLKTVKVAGRAKKMCEDCVDRAREAAEIAEASESVVQNMMGFKGRR